MITRRNSQGLALIELTVVIAIVGILLAMASVAYEPIVTSTRTQATMENLRRLVLLTRSEAIKQGTRAVLCPSTDGMTCSDQWDRRIIIFPDPDNDREADSTSDIVRDMHILSTGETLAYNRKALVFGPLGNTLGANGTFTYCWNQRTDTAHGMIVSRLGRLRKAVDYNSDGIKEKSPGTPLVCPG